MQEKPDFIKPFEEAIDELWRNYPPRIELHGWWWKKYIPYYRNMRYVMQGIIENEWKENHEKIKECVRKNIIEEEKMGSIIDGYKRY